RVLPMPQSRKPAASPCVEQNNSALRLELAMMRTQLREQTMQLVEASRRLSELDIEYESERIEECVKLVGVNRETTEGSLGSGILKNDEEEVCVPSRDEVEGKETFGPAQDGLNQEIHSPPRVDLHRKVERLIRLLQETADARELNHQASQAAALAAEREREAWRSEVPSGWPGADASPSRALDRASKHLTAYARYRTRSERRTRYVEELDERLRRLIVKLGLLLHKYALSSGDTPKATRTDSRGIQVEASPPERHTGPSTDPIAPPSPQRSRREPTALQSSPGGGGALKPRPSEAAPEGVAKVHPERSPDRIPAKALKEARKSAKPTRERVSGSSKPASRVSDEGSPALHPSSERRPQKRASRSVGRHFDSYSSHGPRSGTRALPARDVIRYPRMSRGIYGTVEGTLKRRSFSQPIRGVVRRSRNVG
ncbi:hypothetical protein FOZ63_030989, partial [Perkinsus olseni]